MATDYTRRDFNAIKGGLLSRASQVLPDWTDRDPSDFGMLFVDLWAYMGDVLHYYIDRAEREAFLSTATQRESVLAIANLLDYVPSGRSAAVSSVVVKNSNTSTAYTLPEFTVFTGKDGSSSFTCFTTESNTIGANASVSIAVTEGSMYLETSSDGYLGKSSGQPSQKFTIPYKNVVEGSIRLFVKEDGITNTEYRKVDRISEALFGERVFSATTDAYGVTTVLLGSRVNGLIPATNSIVSARFATSSGAAGNYGLNTIVGFKNAISSDLSILSSTIFIGGTDVESIESMRSSIPLTTRPQDRAVTLDDFIDLTLGVSGVYKATATYNSGSVTIYPVALQSNYTTSSVTSLTVSSDMSTRILNSVSPKALLGVTTTVAASVSLVPVNISAKVVVNDRYVAGWVSNDVTTALKALFEFNNVSFGQTLTLSEVFRTIINVEGVDYAEIDATNTPPGVFSTTSSGVSQKITPASTALLKVGTITLYVSGGITT